MTLSTILAIDLSIVLFLSYLLFRILISGFEMLYSALNSPHVQMRERDVERRALLEASLDLFMQITKYIVDNKHLVEICLHYASLKFFKGISRASSTSAQPEASFHCAWHALRQSIPTTCAKRLTRQERKSVQFTDLSVLYFAF